MVEPHEQIREVVARFRRVEALRHRARWALARGELPPRALELDPAYALPRLDARLLDTLVRAELPTEEKAASAAHLMRLAAERALADFRTELVERALAPLVIGDERRPTGRWAVDLFRPEGARTTLWEGMDAPLRDLARRADEAGRRRNEAVGRWVEPLTAYGRHPDAGPEPTARQQSATEFLRATRDARDHAREILGAPKDHRALFAALADRAAGKRVWSQHRRIADVVEALGLGPGLSANVRVEPGPRGFRPRLIQHRPRRFVLGTPGTDLGLVSWMLLGQSVGRAAAVANVSMLPPAFSWQATASVPRTFGRMVASVVVTPEVLARAVGLGQAEASEHARRATAWALLESRMAAAVAMGGDLPTRLEEAFGVSVPASLARLLLGTPSGGGVRARAAMMAPLIGLALRDRYDEDWWRNPRAAEPVRAACALGGRLSAEAWARELDAEPSADAIGRAGGEHFAARLG